MSTTTRQRTIDFRSAESQIGRVIQERYRLESVLGTGGSASVFKAIDLRDGETAVALKLMHGDKVGDTLSRARFDQEAQLGAELRHPNVVAVLESGATTDGQPYLVMSFIDGTRLSNLMKHIGAMPADRIIGILQQLLEVLCFAHAKGFIHRDLKPDNILISQTGTTRDRVGVLDFGVAKVIERGLQHLEHEEYEAPATQVGQIVGTPRYLSPEQAMGAPVSVQTDLYPLGVMAYEMLTGGPLFEAPTAITMALAHVKEIPAPMVIDGLRVAGPLVDLVMAWLEKAPEDRPGGAAGSLAMLEFAAEAPFSAVATTPNIGPIPGAEPVDDAAATHVAMVRPAALVARAARANRPAIEPRLTPRKLRPATLSRATPMPSNAPLEGVGAALPEPVPPRGSGGLWALAAAILTFAAMGSGLYWFDLLPF